MKYIKITFMKLNINNIDIISKYIYKNTSTVHI